MAIQPIGNVALFNNTGANNTALGNVAGTNLTIGDNNIDIGYNVNGVAGESNTIRIGNSDINNTFIQRNQWNKLLRGRCGLL